MKCISELFNDISTIKDAVTALKKDQEEIKKSNQKLVNALDRIEKKDSYELKLDIKDILVFHLYRWKMEADRIRTYMYLFFFSSIFFALISVVFHVKLWFFDAFICVVGGIILNFFFIANLFLFIKIELSLEEMNNEFASKRHKYIRDVNLIEKFSKIFYTYFGMPLYFDRRCYIVIAIVYFVIYYFYGVVMICRSMEDDKTYIILIAAIMLFLIGKILLGLWNKIK